MATRTGQPAKREPMRITVHCPWCGRQYTGVLKQLFNILENIESTGCCRKEKDHASM